MPHPSRPRGWTPRRSCTRYGVLAVANPLGVRRRAPRRLGLWHCAPWCASLSVAAFGWPHSVACPDALPKGLRR